MKFNPRPYQSVAIDHALERLSIPTSRTLYSSPIGSGKSIVERSQRPVIHGKEVA